MNGFLRYFAIVLMGLSVWSGCNTTGNDRPEIDLELPSNNWSRDTLNPIITGNGDSIVNIGDPAIVYHGKFKLWAGCVGEDNSLASICYSESVDGTSWSAPVIVFSPSLEENAWDNQKTEIPTVIYDENEADPQKRYKMWYGGADQSNPDLIKIGLAYSADGISWTRLDTELSLDQQTGLVLKPGFDPGDAGVVSDPTALIKDGIYHLWYNSFGEDNDILVSHATSTNGYHWNKDANNPVLNPEPGWEDLGPGEIINDVSHPAVLTEAISGAYLMWYGSFDDSNFETYNGIGFAYSSNGTNWTKSVHNPVFEPSFAAGEDLGISTGVTLVVVNNVYHMFYGGVDENGLRVINHATSP